MNDSNWKSFWRGLIYYSSNHNYIILTHKNTPKVKTDVPFFFVFQGSVKQSYYAPLSPNQNEKINDKPVEELETLFVYP